MAFFENLTRHQTREFGPWNVMNLITAAVMIAVAAVSMTSDRPAFRFQNYAMMVMAISVAAQALEPAFPREHTAARALRVVWLVSFALGIVAAISMTVR